MAKFRNVDKRWLRETLAQRRRRNFWEAGIILKHRVDRTLAKYGYGAKPVVQGQTNQPASLGDALEEYYSAHPMTMVRSSVAPKKRMCALDPPVILDDGDAQKKSKIPAPRPMKEETWGEYLSLKFYRFQRWSRSLWAAARFTHPVAWFLVSRHRARP